MVEAWCAYCYMLYWYFFFFQAEDGIRDVAVTGVQTCALPISYCVVPYTRGPERSRASDSILREVRQLAELGYSEVQLLGQTVNSYADPTPRKMRSEERRVGKECRSRWSPYH